MDADLGSATGKIKIDASDAKRDIKGVESSLDDMSRNGSRNVKALNKALLGVGVAAVGAFGFAIKVAADFQETMSGIKAVTGATESQMESLRKKALKLGADTSFSAKEAAGAMEELGKAGLTVDEILNGAADATVALAAAGGVDLSTAATIAANAMNQFGLSAEQMPHIADLIAGAANSSAIDVNDFGMSLAQAGAVANLTGLSFDDLALAVTAMGNAGIKGSDAGTSLKVFLTGLHPVTEKQIKLFDELGLTVEANATAMNSTGNAFYDAQGKVKPMTEIAGTLAKALEGMSDMQKTATLELLFGTDAIRAAGVIAETGAEGFDTLAASMGGISAADVARTRLDNVKGSVEQLRGSIETFIISAATPLLGFFKDALDGATKFVNKLNEIDDRTKAIILATIGAAGAIATIVGGLGIFVHLAGPVVAGLKLMSLAFAQNTLAMLTNPWVLLAAAIAALVVGIIYAYNHFEGFRKVVDSVIKTVVELGKAIWEWLQQNAIPTLKAFAAFFMEEILPRVKEFAEALLKIIEAVVSFFTDTLVPGVQAAWHAVQDVILAFWDWFDANVLSTATAFIELFIAIFDKIVWFFREILIPQIQGAWGVIGPIIEGAFKFIIEVIKFALDVIVGIVKFFIDFVQKAWALFGDNILSAIKIVFDIMKTIIETVLGIIRGIVQVVTGLISGDWSKAWEGIKTIFTTIWDAIKDAIKIVTDIIKLTIETFIDGVKLVLSSAWEAIKLAASTAWDLIKLAITAPIILIPAIIQGIWNGIRSAASTAWSWIEVLATLAWGAIKTAIMAPINLVKSLLQDIWDTISSAAGAAWRGVKSVIEPIVNTIVAIIQKIIDVSQKAIDIAKRVGGWLPSTGGSDVPFVPFLARGAVVTRQTLAMISERGPEAVIPLTDPGRALELMRDTGLDMLAMASFGSQSGSSSTSPAPSGGVGEVVHIDHAEFYDSVDVNMLLTQAEFALQGGRF